jgi:hypothetical protein
MMMQMQPNPTAVALPQAVVVQMQPNPTFEISHTVVPPTVVQVEGTNLP